MRTWMRRPPLELDASSSKALAHSNVTDGKLDSNRVTPSGVPGLIRDSETN